MSFEIIGMIEVVTKVPKGSKDKDGKALTPKIITEKYFEQLIKQMNDRNYVEVVKQKINDPVKVADEVFNAFLEVTVKIKGFDGLLGFIIDFGPTSVEILKPEGNVSIDSGEMEGVLNDLIAKIQDYDKKLKIITSEFMKLKNQKT